MLHNAVGGGGEGGWLGVSDFPEKAFRFNIVIITRGWVGIKFPGKKPLCNI